MPTKSKWEYSSFEIQIKSGKTKDVIYMIDGIEMWIAA